MENNKYNGWTNYATWRVNLEIFDCFDLVDVGMEDQDECSVADFLKDYAEEAVMSSANEDSLATSYAFAFMADVNWYEIAQALMENVKQ